MTKTHIAAIPAGLLCLVSSPAFAQSGRAWTNADLGKPLSADRPTVTSEQLQSLAEHQFVYVPSESERSYRGGVFIMGSSSTAGPFGEFAQMPSTRLDGSLWSDPPWGLRPYWRGRYGQGGWSAPMVPFGDSTIRAGHHRREGGPRRAAATPSPSSTLLAPAHVSAGPPAAGFGIGSTVRRRRP